MTLTLRKTTNTSRSATEAEIIRIMIEENSKPNVQEYTDHRQFLAAFVAYQKRRNPRWSLGVWARQLGLKSKSGLTMLIKGQRNPGPELIEALSSFFGFNEHEKNYFQLLIQLGKRNPPKVVRMDLSQASATPETNSMAEHLKNWGALVIKEILLRDGPTVKDEEISRQLINTYSAEQIGLIRQALFDLKVLEISEGKVIVGDQPQVRPWSRAQVQLFHEQSLAACRIALEQANLHRVFQSTILRVSEKNLPQARLLIQNFQRDFSRLVDDEEGELVYQLNLHFFSVIKSHKD